MENATVCVSFFCRVYVRLRKLSCHHLGKRLLVRFHVYFFLFVVCLFVVVISHFGLNDRILVLIIQIPGHCIL